MTRAYPHPTPATETEAPFAIYVAVAREQIARTRANSDWLNGTRSRDGDIANALAILNREADRSERARMERGL